MRPYPPGLPGDGDLVRHFGSDFNKQGDLGAGGPPFRQKVLRRQGSGRDGQDAGEMLLDIEKRIGEIAEKEHRAAPVHISPEAGFASSGKPLKHERLGFRSRDRMNQSVAIARNPEIVEKIKARVAIEQLEKDLGDEWSSFYKYKINKLEASKDPRRLTQYKDTITADDIVWYLGGAWKKPYQASLISVKQFLDDAIRGKTWEEVSTQEFLSSLFEDEHGFQRAKSGVGETTIKKFRGDLRQP